MMKKKKIVIWNAICHHMVIIKIKIKMLATVVAVAITMSLPKDGFNRIKLGIQWSFG